MLTGVETRELRKSAGGISREPRTRITAARPDTAHVTANSMESHSVARLTTIVALVEHHIEMLRRSVETTHDELRTLRHDVDALTRCITRPTAPGRRISLTTLTRQEQRIALLVADGMSNGEVGADLSITGETVRGHLKSVFRKLGIHSRWELAYLLRTEGWRSTSSLQVGATQADRGEGPPLDAM